MGNRAVITNKEKKFGIYLHWNGGPDSIEAFTQYAYICGVRDPKQQDDYTFARLTQIIANYFDGTLSIGIGLLDDLDCDNHDNGVYVLGKGWKIVERYGSGCKSESEGYEVEAMIEEINSKQPKKLQKAFRVNQKRVNNGEEPLRDIEYMSVPDELKIDEVRDLKRRLHLVEKSLELAVDVIKDPKS